MAKVIRDAYPPAKRRKKDDELCCCGPKLHLYGQVEAKTRAVGAKIDLSESIGLQTIANTALSTQHQPNALANGFAQAALSLNLAKPKDCVALIVTYTIFFEVDSECGPCSVEIETSGAVASKQHCLPSQGSFGVSTAELFTGEDYFNHQPGQLLVRGRTTDCEGRVDECVLTLFGG